MKIDWSEKNINEIELFFSTDIKRGLDNEGYRNSRRQHGANIIKSKILKNQNFYGLERKKRDIKTVFLQAVSIFGVIYIALIAILRIVGTDINIYVIVPFLLFSAVSTLILNIRAETKRAYLFKLSRPKALVIRNGKRRRVFIESIVPGDVIILSTGDIVPADARLVVSNSLSCIEITDGNKTEYSKKTDKALNIPAVSLLDYENAPIVNSNMVFAADIIAAGSGLAVVTATGKNTRIIKTFGDAEYEENAERDSVDELSILQKDAAEITRKFSLTSISFAMFLLLFGIARQRDLEAVLIASFTVIASMFADKLPVITDFAVKQGLFRLSSHGILIKKAATVDKLNAVDTLIAKKTETYIRDILKAQKIYCDHWDYDIGSGNTVKIGQILSYMVLCCSVSEARTKKGKIIYTGSAVDVAVIRAFQKCNLNFAGLNEVYQKFDKTTYNPRSGNRSILVYSRTQNKFLLICFGEAESILRRCSRRKTGENYLGIDYRAFDIYRRKIDDLYKSYDLVMAVAVKEYMSNNLKNVDEDESELDFIALVSFSEADAFGVYQNIEYLKKGGMSPIMIVDANNHATRRAAVRLGVAGSERSGSVQILDDEKIDGMDSGAFYANAHKYKLFMPISIPNRVKFLKALRFRKKITAVTVNDLAELPLLNESDISFTSMAVETGVLTNKASVILKNLSVSTIVNAVKGAVLIYKNVHNAISFAASLFTAQYLMIFFALILDGSYLLNTVQMLWSGLAAGYMCAAAMCFGEDTNKWYVFRKNLRNYKKYKERTIKSGIGTGVFIFFTSILSFGICLVMEGSEYGVFGALMKYVGSDKDEVILSIVSAQTGMFISLIFACLTVALLNIKSSHIADLKILKNTVFVATAAGNIILLFTVIAVPPLRENFGFSLLSVKSAMAAVVIGIVLPVIRNLWQKR